MAVEDLTTDEQVTQPSKRVWRVGGDAMKKGGCKEEGVDVLRLECRRQREGRQDRVMGQHHEGGAVDALQWMVDSIYKHEITDPASLTFTETEVDQAIQAGEIAFAFKWGLPLVPLNNPEISKVVDECAIGLQACLNRQPRPAAVRLLIGPEVGFAAAEVDRARQAGFQVVSLGPRRLKVETAALAALTLLQYAWGDLA
jgi:hypothetical protein